jgi:UDP-N-acetyl-D-mannosaminuronic acid dehydrogenase
LEEVLAQADVLVIGAPHQQYRSLSTSRQVVDVWNLLGQGTTV